MVLLSVGAALAATGAYYGYTQKQQPTPTSVKGDIEDVKRGSKKRTVANYNATKGTRQFFTPANGPRFNPDYYGTSEQVKDAPTVDLPKELPTDAYPPEFEDYVSKKRATDRRYSKMEKIKGGDEFMKSMWKEWRAKKMASARAKYTSDTINAATAAIMDRTSSKCFSGENFHTYCLEAQKDPLLIMKHRNQGRFSPYFNLVDDGAYTAKVNNVGFGAGAFSRQGGIGTKYALKSTAQSHSTRASVMPPVAVEIRGNTVTTPSGYTKIKPRNFRGLF